MDVAASEFWKDEKKVYDLDFKTEGNDGSQCHSGESLMGIYMEFCKDYPMISIEDPFDQVHISHHLPPSPLISPRTTRSSRSRTPSTWCGTWCGTHRTGPSLV